ncbi:MAG: DUF512 domain-containing protein, partial [Clostridia bacterium]|nr:DUF512 domain-containing protein [Clostridia bacterium]
ASYEGMPQLENGVGLVAMLREGFDTALAQDAGAPQSPPRVVSVATGTAAFGVIENCAMRAQKAIAGLECLVYAIENRFFGENVNVAGLVTGRDLIEQLRGRRLGSELLIPAAMLRHERDLFLDDVSVSDVERELDTKVTPVENDGAQLLRAMTRGGPGM